MPASVSINEKDLRQTVPGVFKLAQESDIVIGFSEGEERMDVRSSLERDSASDRFDELWGAKLLNTA